MSSHRLTDNPFHVLGISPLASRETVEKAGRRVLAALAAQSPGAQRYETPAGPQVRDAHRVRRALTRLRDVDERIHHEIWAELSPRSLPRPLPSTPAKTPGWAQAARAMGWWAR
ncbi:MAG: hypothetical protein JKY37_24985 [Nannocystaceae bacterium]|nr:hypothetical protein [Nannocystaceae bacterium]